VRVLHWTLEPLICPVKGEVIPGDWSSREPLCSPGCRILCSPQAKVWLGATVHLCGTSHRPWAQVGWRGFETMESQGLRPLSPKGAPSATASLLPSWPSQTPMSHLVGVIMSKKERRGEHKGGKKKKRTGSDSTEKGTLYFSSIQGVRANCSASAFQHLRPPPPSLLLLH
jgi:hypothetical protein